MQSKNFNFENVPENCHQLVLVEAKSWNSIEANLQCFECENVEKEWKIIGEKIPCVLGKNGVGWGNYKDLQQKPAEIPLKIEGDSKAPAGLFQLTTAFGYQKKSPNKNFPYFSINENLVAVDDSNSKYYNKILDSCTILEKDWNSAEKMLREDGLYKFGVVINYNLQPAIAGRGSCIFMHIWRNQNTGTEGCTAMVESNLLTIIKWLNFNKFPMLLLVVQQ